MELESYIDYKKLPELLTIARACFNNDPTNWVEIQEHLGNLKDSDEEMINYLKDHPNVNVDWLYANLYPPYTATNDAVIKQKFQPIVDYVQNMHNVFDVVLIFNGPHSIIPDHDHPEDLERRVHRILLGIFVPESGVAIVNNKKTIKHLDMYVVHGDKLHSGYNNSDHWWIQLIVSVNNE